MVKQNSQFNAEPSKSLEPFQKLVADYWRQQGNDVKALIDGVYGRSIFGSRALGYYCLDNEMSSEQQLQIINHLFDIEQYDLVNKLFGRLKSLRALSLGAYALRILEVRGGSEH